jgi:tRNA pseudouridine38-40 synthase
MDIAYDGSFAYGFQRQDTCVSVQGVLEAALKAVCGTYVPVVGASRTDRGVHALQNVVSFVLRDESVFERVVRRLPVMLPSWLTVRACVQETANFSARFSAAGKSYAYVFIKQGSWSPFLARYAYRLDYPVQVRPMDEAAHALLGMHDFKCFGNVDPSRPHRDTICTLHRADVVETEKTVLFLVSGDHFLYHMVRRMAYFVLKAGQGRNAASTWGSVFTSPDAPYTRQVMSAAGLYLVKVDYT